MNRLAGEPSAYLRQHADNPVHWQPYDDAAFAEAVARDVPIFLSIGYAACHWCHVMAAESFADPGIAAQLNSGFVCIKVDREERPDVDDAYMAATQALSGEGGWPMSVFLTPAGRAFFAGTYFPPAPQSGRPSFAQVLDAVREAWTERRDLVEETAADLAQALAKPLWQVRTGHLDTAVELPSGVDIVPAATAEKAAAAMAAAEDGVHGGFGAAPKFPPTPALAFLIRHGAAQAAGAPAARALAGRTLGAMVRSALFDQLGGGFSRYSVTADWSEPHYEKMLYDNAGLLQVLVDWIRLAEAGGGTDDAGGTGDVDGADDTGEADAAGGPAPLSVAEARDAVAMTVEWLLREMQLPGGGFASSLDADVVIDGVHYEGACYKWTARDFEMAARLTVAREAGGDAEALSPAQLADARQLALETSQAMGQPDAAERAADTGTIANATSTAPAPNATSTAQASSARPLNPGRRLSAENRRQWERIKPALLSLRAQRAMPERDGKVVAGWNGMLISALAQAGTLLGQPAWVAAAVGLGGYVQRVHWDGQLSRVSHAGQARGIKGMLEDYAACAQGYVDLYLATGDGRWSTFAQELLLACERDFLRDGTLLNHGGQAAGLQGSRFADPFDNATASGPALLAGALTSWAALTGSGRHRGLVAGILALLPSLVDAAPRSAGGLLAVAAAVQAGPLEVAIVGPDGPQRQALLQAARASAPPGAVVAVWDGQGQAPIPLFAGRAMAGDRVLAYVCRNMVCTRPVDTVEQLRPLLQ